METVFCCEKFFKNGGQCDPISAAKAVGIELCGVSDTVFEKISNRENCDGVIGLANFWATDAVPENFQNYSTILVAEGIEKSGNLGALMRSAESAAVDALILCNPVTDIFNPNVIRASQGAVFNLTTMVTNNETAFALLKKNSAEIFATTPSAATVYFDENFRGNVAIIVGSERRGLSDFWLRNGEVRKISLPQAGICDSLNVNDAAVVILYEILRQRMRTGDQGP
jgi:TrmH family RNA methyltransferase